MALIKASPSIRINGEPLCPLTRDQFRHSTAWQPQPEQPATDGQSHSFSKALFAALSNGAKPQAIVLPTSATALQQGYDLNLNGLLDGFSYSDEITAVSPLTNISIFIGGGTNEALLRVTPINSTGTVGTPREVTWNLQNDTTTNFSGFGNFQFATNQLPATTLEIAGSSQLAVDS